MLSRMASQQRIQHPLSMEGDGFAGATGFVSARCVRLLDGDAERTGAASVTCWAWGSTSRLMKAYTSRRACSSCDQSPTSMVLRNEEPSRLSDVMRTVDSEQESLACRPGTLT